jgi:hypothetical protein
MFLNMQYDYYPIQESCYDLWLWHDKGFKIITDIVILIKKRKFTKKKQRATNEITEEDLDFFLDTIKNIGGYPKVRDLKTLLEPKLNLVKINAILRYLEKSKRLEIDLDGNIIWIREEGFNHHSVSVAEVANLSPAFQEYFSTKDVDAKDES